MSTIAQGRNVSETEVAFLRDERLIAVVRRDPWCYSVLGESWPPYDSWYTYDLPFGANGPGMGYVGPQLILASREIPRYSPEPEEYPVSVWVWHRNNVFRKVFELDKGIDVGYPDVEPIVGDSRCSLVTYYVNGDIKVAKLRYTEDARYSRGYAF